MGLFENGHKCVSRLGSNIVGVYMEHYKASKKKSSRNITVSSLSGNDSVGFLMVPLSRDSVEQEWSSELGVSSVFKSGWDVGKALAQELNCWHFGSCYILPITKVSFQFKF